MIKELVNSKFWWCNGGKAGGVKYSKHFLNLVSLVLSRKTNYICPFFRFDFSVRHAKKEQKIKKTNACANAHRCGKKEAETP